MCGRADDNFGPVGWETGSNHIGPKTPVKGLDTVPVSLECDSYRSDTGQRD